MRRVFVCLVTILMLAGTLLSPLKGVSFACAPEGGQLSVQLVAVDLPQLTPADLSDHGFVLVPSAVPCLVAIPATAVQYESGSSGKAEPVPGPAGLLAGVDVNPSHGPPIIT